MKAVSDYNRFVLPPKTVNCNCSRWLAVFNNRPPKQLAICGLWADYNYPV